MWVACGRPCGPGEAGSGPPGRGPAAVPFRQPATTRWRPPETRSRARPPKPCRQSPLPPMRSWRTSRAARLRTPVKPVGTGSSPGVAATPGPEIPRSSLHLCRTVTATTTGVPQPIRRRDGAPILGPRNEPLERENPDLLVPPATDAGSVPNLKFSFAAAHNRLALGRVGARGDRARAAGRDELAGVNMRLKPGGIRELHWHKEAEWAFMLAGRARITAVDAEGRNFLDDVGVGDIWNFPAGIPTRSRGSRRVASSSSCSTTATSTRTRRF